MSVEAQAARRYGVPEWLLLRVSGAESGRRQYDRPGHVITSPAGALGEMQLMPGTARSLGVNPNNQAQNVMGGAKYLRQMYDRFHDWKLAVAAYNAGPNAVAKYGGIPPYAETRRYVQSIFTGAHPVTATAPPPESGQSAMMAPNPNIDVLRRQVASSLIGLSGQRSPDYSPLFGQIAQLRAQPAYKQVAPPAAGTPGFQVQGPVDGRAARAITLAKEYLGTPYHWGGSTPQTGFDCSGLLQYIWAKQGVNIPRTSQQQFRAGRPVAKGALKPGDAVFFEATSAGPGHVGVYVGNGRFLESPHSGANVRISKLAGRTDYVGARRLV